MARRSRSTASSNALERGHEAAPNVGAQDVHIEAGKLATEIPHKDATELLGWAPGFLLTNEGGEGHAEQIFLRGFDAREGQDIEMRVNGDVVNQAGNLHGNGYADLHFIIPELVQSLRVIEGPYDPRQGNFAVAGSADYELGLDASAASPRATRSARSARSARCLLWGSPTTTAHNFGGVELYQTDGFGQNRDARRATALGQIEGKLGEDGLWRLTSGVYITDYHSAGVIREDDYDGRPQGLLRHLRLRPGRHAARVFVLGDVEFQHDDFTTHHQLSLTAQTMKLREDFTGFLARSADAVPESARPARRSDRPRVRRDHRAGAGLDAAQGQRSRSCHSRLELGYFARLDATSGQQYRLECAANPPFPYHKDADLDAITRRRRPVRRGRTRKLAQWAALRGGVRTDLFTYDVIDNCAVHDIAHPSPSNPPGDASCLSQDDFGKYREPVQRATTSGTVDAAARVARARPVRRLVRRP